MFSLPGYQVMGVLGRGGFGVVYRARQLTIDREVAVKVDTRVILDDRDQRRFLREVRAAGRLSGHPNVVEIYQAGMLDDGHPYLVMELCPGGSLAGRAPLAPGEVTEIGRGIADALAAAHGLGVLHRDIKPGNILIKRYGTVGLADFGLAALIDTGRESSVTLAALTPAYAAPEAFRLEPPSPRSDVYALGATLYALLAGRPPRFPPGSDLSLPEILQRHDTPVPDLPGVPPGLTAVLRRALEKDPGRRQPDAAALRDELAAWRPGAAAVPVPRFEPATDGTGAGPRRAPVPAERGGASPARRAVLLSGAALAAILVLLGVWYLVVGSGHDPVDPPGSASSPGRNADADQQLGIPTVVDGCPAAAVSGAGARCAERAECWSGPVLINGEVNSIRRLPCDQDHSWETYAIAAVPPDVASPYQDVLEVHPTVVKVCAVDNLVASRYAVALDIPADQWESTVLPPTPDDRVARRAVYRCLGKVSGKTSVGTAFRPR